MKELSIEEKAKAYDEALKVLHKYDGANIMFSQSLKEEMFPELKEESEDERIRQFLIHEVTETSDKIMSYRNMNKKDVLAWLEKQGEDNKKEYSVWVGGGEINDYNLSKEEAEKLAEEYKKDGYDDVIVEKQGEQRSAVEMKTPEESLGIDSDTYNKIVDECVYGEKNHSWTEEDETALSDALWCCKQAASIAKDENDMGNAWYAENWLKSLKDKVQPQQEWSEEDEYKYNTILHHLDLRKEKYKKECNQEEQDRYQCLYDWLKSLKERYTWKPNEKQMHYLSWIANIKLGDSVVEQDVSKHLNELHKDLKKLMEK